MTTVNDNTAHMSAEQAAAFTELVKLRQALSEVEAALNNLRMVNVADASAEDMVSLDIRGETLKHQIMTHQQRYLAAMGTYMKTYITGAN